MEIWQGFFTAGGVLPESGLGGPDSADPGATAA
jgi:hypothetical protein